MGQAPAVPTSIALDLKCFRQYRHNGLKAEETNLFAVDLADEVVMLTKLLTEASSVVYLFCRSESSGWSSEPNLRTSQVLHTENSTDSGQVIS